MCFLGYPYGVKGFKVLNLAFKKIFVSRDVLFHETVFPYVSSTYSSSTHSTISLPHIFPSLDPYIDSLPSVSHPTDLVITSIPDSPSHSDPTPDLPHSPLPHNTLALPVSDLLAATQAPSLVSIPIASIDPIPAFVPSLRKSTRITKNPAYLQDYKCGNVVHDQFDPSNPTIKTSSGSTFSISCTKYPLSIYLDSSSLSPSYAHFCSLITAIIEPKS